MKKIISLVVFLILLTWTWSMIHSDPTVSFETHSIIQQKLAEIIQLSVQKHRPQAKEFNLVRLWTETLTPDKISAHFTYRFKEGDAENASQETISGEALLKKTTTAEQAQENWKVEQVQTSTNQIVFQEGESIDSETPAAKEDISNPAQ